MHFADDIRVLEEASKASVEQLHNEIHTLANRIHTLKRDLHHTSEDIRLQSGDFLQVRGMMLTINCPNLYHMLKSYIFY